MKYNYNVRTGLVRVKTNTKKYFYSGLAAVTVLAFGTGATFAASTPVISENAANQACFGQWRASTADGSAFSERKGTNAAHNVSDKAACLNN
jgi:hypothetical protein